MGTEELSYNCGGSFAYIEIFRMSLAQLQNIKNTVNTPKVSFSIHTLQVMGQQGHMASVQLFTKAKCDKWLKSVRKGCCTMLEMSMTVFSPVLPKGPCKEEKMLPHSAVKTSKAMTGVVFSGYPEHHTVQAQNSKQHLQKVSQQGLKTHLVPGS